MLFSLDPRQTTAMMTKTLLLSGLHESLVWLKQLIKPGSQLLFILNPFYTRRGLDSQCSSFAFRYAFLNLFPKWSTLDGKLPSPYLWPNSLSTLVYISAFFCFFCLWKPTSSYNTRYYISHLLNQWHAALPILFSVPFASFSSSCTLHFVHWLLYRIHLNQSLCRYLENSWGTMHVEYLFGKRRWSYCHHRIPLL